MLLGAWNSNGGPTNHFWPCWRGKLQNSSQQRSSLIIVVWIELIHLLHHCILYVASYSLTRMLDHWRSRVSSVSSSWHHDYKRDLSLTAHALQFWRLWSGKKRQDREPGESLGETDVISIYIYISILNHIENGLSTSHLVRIDHEVILRPTKWQISLDVSCSFGLRLNDMADSKSHESKGMRSLERHESTEKC